MLSIKRINGFTFIELLITISLLSALGLGATQYYTYQVLPERRAESAAGEIGAIKAAALQYHLEYQSWPATITELRDLGLYNGPILSGVQTPYTFGVTPDGHFSVSVDVQEAGVANRTAGKLNFSSVTGSSVTALEGVPSRETIQSYFLARRVIDGCPECNTMEADIDMNGNDIQNINEFDAQLARIEEAYIETASIRNIEDVERIVIGDSSISSAGTGLLIDSDNVSITGGLSVGGTLDMQGNDINNVGRVTAAEVFATTGQIDDITGVNLNYVNGTVQILAGQSLNYVTGEIGAITGIELDYLNGTINNLAGDSLTYQSGWIGSASGNSLNYTTGWIGSVNGNSLNYATGYIGDVSGLSLNYQSGWIGSVSGSNLTYSSGSIGNLSGNTATYNNFIGGNFSGNAAQFNSLAVSGHTTLANVTSNSHTTNTLQSDLLELVNLNVSNRLTTNRLVSSQSSLGVADATSLSVTGQVTAGSVQTTSLTAPNANITTLSGQTATFNRVNANAFYGGTFYGSNFITPVTSTNQNRQLADQLLAQWNSCVSQGGCQ